MRLAVLCCALSGFAREATAQQSASIEVTATVTSSYSTYGLRADPSVANAVAGERATRRIAIRGVGVLEVEGASGAQVWLQPPATDGRLEAWMPPSATTRSGVPGAGAPRLVQASIAYLAN